jgi:hypothetical protein
MENALNITQKNRKGCDISIILGQSVKTLNVLLQGVDKHEEVQYTKFVTRNAVRCEAFTATQVNAISSSLEASQLVKTYRRLKDLL